MNFLFPFVISALVYVSAALITPPPRPNNVQVGITYCTYYTGQKDDPSWNTSIIVDIPFLNYCGPCYYSSCDPQVIRYHIECFEDLGIDFVMVTWDGEGFFPDYADKVIFETAMNYGTHIKFCILVQPFNETFGYNYSYIYNYIYNTFVIPYSGIYYYYAGKPLILFFNAVSLTGGFESSSVHLQYDERFTVKIFGNWIGANWLYENFSPYHWGPSPRDNHVPVIPRFDETRIPNRPLLYKRDPNLDEGLYDATWQKALHCVKTGRAEVITIQCWNEYAERSNIEPHVDGTANVDNFYLYRKTKEYIQLLRTVQVEPSIWYDPYFRLSFQVITTLLIIIMLGFSYL